VLLAGCGLPALAQSQTETTEDAAGASVEGVASYRERIALPPGAVFEAAIEDVSRADSPTCSRAQVPGGSLEIPYR
jgi:putative lipoprotein